MGRCHNSTDSKNGLMKGRPFCFFLPNINIMVTSVHIKIIGLSITWSYTCGILKLQCVITLWIQFQIFVCLKVTSYFISLNYFKIGTGTFWGSFMITARSKSIRPSRFVRQQEPHSAPWWACWGPGSLPLSSRSSAASWPGAIRYRRNYGMCLWGL